MEIRFLFLSKISASALTWFAISTCTLQRNTKWYMQIIVYFYLRYLPLLFCSSVDEGVAIVTSTRSSKWTTEVVEFNSAGDGLFDDISCVGSGSVTPADSCAGEGSGVGSVLVSARFRLGEGCSGEGSAMPGCAWLRNRRCCNWACCRITGSS